MGKAKGKRQYNNRTFQVTDNYIVCGSPCSSPSCNILCAKEERKINCYGVSPFNFA